MSDSSKEDQVAYGFIACVGAALLFLIGKKVFYDIYCKSQEQETQENQIQEDPCEVC
jgi:hypothetical protein|tara:strand:+ start:198 stop:368 length:171 start_codon:yes stop_codon:yes gene_type:complete